MTAERALGLVDDRRTVGLRDGAQAGAGDIIVARRNDHRLLAGEPERTMANGDVLRIDAVNAGLRTSSAGV